MNFKRLVIGVMCLIASGCTADFKTEVSENAVRKFHEYLNNSDHEAIYDMSTEGFIKSDSTENMSAFFRGVRDKLGANQGADLQNWNVHIGTSGKVVTLAYVSQYENGEAHESFVFHEAGNQALLHNYNINSRVFIVH